MIALPPGTPSPQAITDAASRIQPYIHRTLVLRSETLDKMTGTNLFFKCENFQKAGAFKSRGAVNAVFSLADHECSKGVCTHSSGNHAAALSRAAALKGIPAWIVMPENSTAIKVEAVRHYGGIITFCEPTLQARESTLEQVRKQTGAEEIHPYNDFRVIAGQATAAKELIEEHPGLDIIVAPVGGGGLLGGTALSCKYFSPDTLVFGAEPEMANDAWKSFYSRQFVPSVNPMTIADGLLTSLGSNTFPIILNLISSILTAGEDNIVRAMRLVWERMKIIIEPSAAVPLAVILENRDLFEGKNVGIIFSGGNTDTQRRYW